MLCSSSVQALFKLCSSTLGGNTNNVIFQKNQEMDHLSLLDLPDLLNMHINALKKDKRTKKIFALSRPGFEPTTS